MSKGSFFDKSKCVFYHFLIFSFLQKLFRGFHTFGKSYIVVKITYSQNVVYPFIKYDFN